jgi:hypothetical protein
MPKSFTTGSLVRKDNAVRTKLLPFVMRHIERRSVGSFLLACAMIAPVAASACVIDEGMPRYPGIVRCGEQTTTEYGHHRERSCSTNDGSDAVFAFYAAIDGLQRNANVIRRDTDETRTELNVVPAGGFTQLEYSCTDNQYRATRRTSCDSAPAR